MPDVLQLHTKGLSAPPVDINTEDVLAGFPPETMQQALSVTPGWLYWVGRLLADMTLVAGLADQARSKTIAELYAEVQSALPGKGDKAPTDKAIENAVKAHPELDRVVREKLLLECERDKARALYEALRVRAALLQTMSANARKEVPI